MNSDGTLNVKALGQTEEIITGDELDNPKVVNVLSNIDDIQNWGKYKNLNQIQDDMGNNLEIHYYYNNVSGQIYYPLDYKIVVNGQARFPIAENVPQNYYNLSN